ncbi:transmembrane protein 247-like [Mauremys reevesii]|uniref:transmembrane protein 247-like n=1 Tax=Mauremys reevesii TaxID=260615 RepID=UPI00193F02D9|nr:transmembrane protein 247-like [Mauremys reevesii]
MDTPENTSSGTSGVTEPPDIRDQDLRMETNSQAELDSLQPEHITNDGEINTWVEMEQPNSRMAQVAETELEKMRLDMELTMLKYQYEEKEKQRQHKEKMEQMRLQSPSGYPAEGCQDLLRPQNQFALFLYCFIFIHVIYTARELLLFFVKKHHLFIIVVTLLYLIKKLWDYLCCFVLPLQGLHWLKPLIGIHSVLIVR